MKELVIFDIDNTLIKGQSQKILLNYLFKKRIIGWFYYLKIYLWFILYKVGIVKNPKKIMEYAFRFLKGKRAEEIDKLIDEFFEEKLKKSIFKEGIDIINKHKKENRELLLVSNALEIIVKKIAQCLNINNYIGTKLEIINGEFTGKIIGDIVYGEKKVVYINNFIKDNNFTFKNSWAYGDHISDLAILKLVSRPFSVNPDNNLRKEALKRKWPILIFNKLT